MEDAERIKSLEDELEKSVCSIQISLSLYVLRVLCLVSDCWRKGMAFTPVG